MTTEKKKSRPSRIGTKKVEEKSFELDFYDDDNVVTERMRLSEQIGSEWRQSKGTGDVSIRTTSETGRHDVNDKKLQRTNNCRRVAIKHLSQKVQHLIQVASFSRRRERTQQNCQISRDLDWLAILDTWTVCKTDSEGKPASVNNRNCIDYRH